MDRDDLLRELAYQFMASFAEDPELIGDSLTERGYDVDDFVEEVKAILAE